LLDIWNRIIAWFAANIPAEHFTFSDGASEEEISAAEARMRVHLPDDVRESYLLHNGTDNRPLFECYSLASLAEIIVDWRLSETVLEQEELGLYPSYPPPRDPQGPVKRVMWNLGWIPIMDADGDHVMIDLDPAPGGKIGQVIERSHEVGPLRLIAYSFREFLSNYADDLEAGKYRYGEDMCISTIHN
jgi:cell wall assembly regulator SMI1